MKNQTSRLEALEAQRKRRRKMNPKPEPEQITDDLVTQTLRLYFQSRSLIMTRDGVEPGPECSRPEELRTAEVAAMLTADMRQHPDWLLVLLTPGEIGEALAAIDAGRIRMGYRLRGGVTKEDFRPECNWQLPDDEREPVRLLADAVDCACKVASAQSGEALAYDQTGQLEDVKEWLLELRRIQELTAAEPAAPGG